MFWTELAETQNPDNTSQSSHSSDRFPTSSPVINGAHLASVADSRSGDMSHNAASNLPRSSHATSGRQLDRAVDPREHDANANGNNVTEQVANLSISPKTVRIPLEVRKSGQYTRDMVPLKE
jgi:hypothetical protein